MSDNNEKFKWRKLFLQLFVFLLLSSSVFADNSTDYSDESGDEMETLLLIQPAPPVIPECGANEVYQSCEVDCINCEQRGMCEPRNCNLAHCDCKMYFVHLTPSGPCEHVSMCPPRKCPKNEVYRHCGPLCEACGTPPCRKMECSSRCFCEEGYRRNQETGECIPEKECPERLNCISNDVVAESGPFSDQCMQTQSETLRANETIEEKKCYCEKGYKRNIHGWCIEESSCTVVECFQGTEFQDCPRKCNTTCWNYGDQNCEEDGQCYPACFCNEGYVLNEFFACIPVETCPPGSNPLAPPLPPPTVGPIAEPVLEEAGNFSIATTGNSSAASAESSSAESSSEAAESSSEKESSSASAESSSEKESSSASEESSSTKTTESEAGTDTEKSKETKLEKTVSEEKATEAPKKKPKKAKGGKIYKSAARPGKTYTEAESSSSSASSAAVASSSSSEASASSASSSSESSAAAAASTEEEEKA